MKKYRLPALLLCLIVLPGLMLSGCAKTEMDLVVGQVGSETITVRDLSLYANYMLMSNGASRSDLAEDQLTGLNQTALDQAVTHKLVFQKARAMGILPLSQENLGKVESQYSGTVASIESSGTSPATYGLTSDDIRMISTFFVVNDLLMAEATKDVTATDEEIQAEYDKLLASQQASYTSNPSAYESAAGDGSTVVVYRPEGFRYVKHILIAYPEDIASQISTATTNGDTAAVASLRKQGMKAIQEKADAVLSRVKAGEDFDSLMAEIGEDPGMKAEPAKTTGYQVGATSSFVPEFLQAAMGLKNAGDTTGLVATDYGYHIIKYVSAVPAGAVALSQVKESIAASVRASKQSQAYQALVEQWTKETAVKKNLAKIPVG